MIRISDVGVYEAGLDSLSRFRQDVEVRGRFIAIYLGLRLMGDSIAPLGSANHTPVRWLEDFLDRMWTKTHKTDSRVVLTAPFGGGGPGGGYSTVTGATAPENDTATNIWRNNFNVQKGIGCVGDASLIESLLESPSVRSVCPHMSARGGSGVLFCSFIESGPTYRGEDHTIWLRKSAEGVQVVDLNESTTYSEYLVPHGRKLPIFALMAVLYSFAPAGVYPLRSSAGIPDFAADFRFPLHLLESIFDCDPASALNQMVLDAGSQTPISFGPEIEPSVNDRAVEGRDLPSEPEVLAANSGLRAELLVARLLSERGWSVRYTGNQALAGYDLLAYRGPDVMRVEVKSSIGFTTPTLTESEWFAAQSFSDTYCIAIVDFVGSSSPDVWVVLNPGESVEPRARTIQEFRLKRSDLDTLRTDLDFL